MRTFCRKSYQIVKVVYAQKSRFHKNLGPRAFQWPKFRYFCYWLIIRMLRYNSLTFTMILAQFTPQKAQKQACFGMIRGQNCAYWRCD